MKAALAAAFLFLSVPALAQDASTIAPPSNDSTASANRGTTGWTGGTRDQKQDEDPSVEARNAANQPWMAEGIDLKGEPRQFSPKKTVE